MKAMLLIVSILIFSLSGFAKTKAQRKYTKESFKFDQKVYYKLKFPDRAKYLGAYVKFVKEIEADKQAANKSTFDLYKLLFPTADAQIGVTHCLTGGIYYTPPCGTLRETEFPASLKTVFAGCTSNNRCAAYFGLGADGNGFCYQNEGNATKQCADQSNPEAIGRLNNALANKYDAKSQALQTALNIDLKNDLIAKECLDKGSQKGACGRLAASVAEYKKVAGGTGGAATTADGVTPNDQMGKGCTQAEALAVAKATNTSTAVGMAHDTVWYKMLTMAAQGACPGGVSIEDMMRKVGACQFSVVDRKQGTVDVEKDLRNMDNLRAAVNNFVSGKNVEKGDQLNNFTKYFGVTPDEFKKVFCAPTAGHVYAQVFGPQGNGSGGLQANSLGGDRRENLKYCVKTNIKKQSFNEQGQMVDRYTAQGAKTCQFKPASAKFDDMLANPSKYQGKYFFSDNINGNCYSLDKVSKSCADIGSLQERQNSKVYCSQGEAPASPGTISMNSVGYFRLKPVYKSDSSDRIATSNDIASQYMFFEYDCGSNFKQGCGIDNNYCRDEQSGTVQ